MSDNFSADSRGETRATEEPPPAAILGPYRLLQKVGEGGMGEVWLAEQREPVRRQVAIKIVKAGMDTANVVARFSAERQALAVMNHPNVAKVFDAGATNTGRPYFAMEFVRGEPITRHCARVGHSLQDRLHLFLQACDGVQHAHQRGIIHRDLKPSNLLVTVVDGHDALKIIDFGLAKAMTHVLTDQPLYTEVGTLLGTPEYMSPEQADLTVLDIDTRTDVYSLGVVLYELVTGMLPFDSQTLRGSGLDELRRMIREVDPPLPSVRLAKGATEVSAPAFTNSMPTPRDLRGDIDGIAMHAIEKARDRRYASVLELADDIRRHLDNRPVRARPRSVTYRLQKFGRRHRGGVAAGALIAALIIGFGANTIVQARRLAREMERATREADVALAVNEFLQNDLLAQANPEAQARPDNAPNPDLTVRQALSRAATAVSTRFDKQPVVEASVRSTIAKSYVGLGLYTEAVQQLRRVVALREQALGPEHRDTLTAMADLGDALSYERKFTEAETILTRAADLEQRVVGEGDPLTMSTLSNLALNYSRMGKRDLAEPMFVRVLDMQRRFLGPRHKDTVTTITNLGTLYWRDEKYGKASGLLSEALSAWQATVGDAHPYTVAVKNNLALVYDEIGDQAQAGALWNEVVAYMLRVLGETHPNTILTLGNLANHQRLTRDFAGAHATLRRGLVVAMASPQSDDGLVASIKSRLVDVLVDEKKYVEADRILQELIEPTLKTYGATDRRAAGPQVNRALILVAQQRWDEAERLLTDALEGLKSVTPATWTRWNGERLLAEVYFRRQRFGDAQRLLESSHQGMRDFARRKEGLSTDHQHDFDEVERALRTLKAQGQGAALAQ